LPEDIKCHFLLESKQGKDIFKLNITPKSALALSTNPDIAFTPSKVVSISDLMKASSPDSEFRRLVSELMQNVKQLTKIQQDHDKLQRLLHEIKVTDIQKKALDEKLQVLKEYMEFMKKHAEQLS